MIISSLISLILIFTNLFLLNEIRDMDDEIHTLKQAMNLEDKNSSKLDDDDNISFLDKLIGIAEIFPNKKPKKGDPIQTKKELLNYLKPDNKKIYDSVRNCVMEVDNVSQIDVKHGNFGSTKELMIEFTDGSVDIFEKNRYYTLDMG